LPEILLSGPDLEVVHSEDAGDFYCEHMFFSCQSAAEDVGSVVENADGEKCVGFLHVPWDAHTSRRPDPNAPAPYGQAGRHSKTREVIGAALKGFIDTAFNAGHDPARVLLTGYGPFSSARDNPTGDFVSHVENVDAAMQKAFGDELASATGVLLAADPNDPPDVQRLRYELNPTGVGQGAPRSIEIRLQKFPVTDVAIDGVSEGSAQKAIEAFEPHAVISMGVHSGDEFRAEFNADDGAMEETPDGYRHRYGLAPRNEHGENYALARAIFKGSQPATVPVATILTGGGTGGV
jgi:pyrrolidone-carboxylate peptidase